MTSAANFAGNMPTGEGLPFFVAPANTLSVIGLDRNAWLLYELSRFRRICKSVFSARPCTEWIAVERKAHKLVESVLAYLEFRLISARSGLTFGKAWRFDPEIVALNNAINFIHQAQLSNKSCPCAYCAGKPFYGQAFRKAA
jgi:hypothetical protein